MPRGISQPGSGRPRSTEERNPAVERWVEKRRQANVQAGEEAAARRAEESDQVPPPDADLFEDEQRWWTTLAALVDKAGTFRSQDTALFRLLVLAYADVERARGKESLSALTAGRRAAAALLARFGCDPSSHPGARVAKQSDEVAGLSDPSYRLRVMK